MDVQSQTYQPLPDLSRRVCTQRIEVAGITLSAADAGTAETAFSRDDISRPDHASAAEAQHIIATVWACCRWSSDNATASRNDTSCCRFSAWWSTAAAAAVYKAS